MTEEIPTLTQNEKDGYLLSTLNGASTFFKMMSVQYDMTHVRGSLKRDECGTPVYLQGPSITNLGICVVQCIPGHYSPNSIGFTTDKFDNSKDQLVMVYENRMPNWKCASCDISCKTCRHHPDSCLSCHDYTWLSNATINEN